MNAALVTLTTVLAVAECFTLGVFVGRVLDRAPEVGP